MSDFIATNRDLIDAIFQLLLLVIPVIITWYIRTYVQGSKAEKDVSAIVRMANVAIDYAENLDKRGDLNVPPDLSRGIAKLKLAGNWLEEELKRAHITITNEEAEQWISAEFQKRVGDVRLTTGLAELARLAVELIRNLEKSGIVVLPPEADRIAYLSGLAADWVVAQYTHDRAAISREEALIWVRAELLNVLKDARNQIPTGADLAELARRAIAFLEGLKASGQLSVTAGGSPESDVELDIATAWLLTEAAKQGLTVSSNQIAEAMKSAYRQYSIA